MESEIYYYVTALSMNSHTYYRYLLPLLRCNRVIREVQKSFNVRSTFTTIVLGEPGFCNFISVRKRIDFCVRSLSGFLIVSNNARN